MQYKIRFKPRALKDGKKLSKKELERIFGKIENMKENMAGDVKHLTDHMPEYRLRVGNYRILLI